MDATKRPLKIPPEFSTYTDNHGIFDLYKRLLTQLLIDKPDDPLAYLVDVLSRDDDDVPQIMILGPAASGKASIAKMVVSRLRCAHITPDMLVQETDLEMRKEAQNYLSENKEIPTSLWVKMCAARVKLFDCVKKGWVMEGFPQTRDQANALAAAGIFPKHCVIMEAPDTVLIERSAGKRVDPETNDIYHVTFDWPTNAQVAARVQEVPGNTEAEMIKKLTVYHRHYNELLQTYRNCYKVINADQPKTDVFSQVMTFLSSQARSSAPHTPRIILLGVTGSGKAVQASLLANKYRIVNISMGQLIKEAVADQTKSGLACKTYVEKNKPVPDAIVLNILRDRLSCVDCVTRGWVLHGYPLTREQGEQLAGAGFIPNRVFSLDVPNDSVIERLTLRATDPITGERYHMLFNPPRTHEVKQRLVVHPKDEESAVLKRISAFSSYTEELQDCYPDMQHISGDQDPHTVFETIESMIVNPLPKHLKN